MAMTYIQAVIEAYGALANSNATVPQQLWTEQIPDEQAGTYPRAELVSLGDQPLFDRAGEMMRTVRSRINVFTTSAAQAEELVGDGGVIRDYFANTTVLSITGKSNRLWPGPYHGIGIAQDRTKDGHPVYVGSLEHMCEMF
jgi:hypothetical protein